MKKSNNSANLSSRSRDSSLNDSYKQQKKGGMASNSSTSSLNNTTATTTAICEDFTSPKNKSVGELKGNLSPKSSYRSINSAKKIVRNNSQDKSAMLMKDLQ